MPHNESPEATAKGADEMRRRSVTYLLLMAVFILTSVLSIWFVSKMFGGRELVLSLSFITPSVAVRLGAFLLVFYLLDSLRFYFVLRTLDLQITFWYTVKLTFINVFVSAITPFATGGGFAQVYFLTKKGVPLGSAMAGSTIRTLLTIIFFLIAAPVMLLINPALFDLIGDGYTVVFGITAGIFCGIVLFIIWVVIKEKSVKRFLYRIIRFSRRKRLFSPRRARKICLGAFREVGNFNRGVHLFLRGSKKHLVFSLLFTGAFLMVLFSLPLLLTQSMGYSIPPVFTYQAMTIITFVMYFALTPGASGIAEGGFALLFSGVVDENDIASLTLLWRSLSVYVGTLVGMVVFYPEVFIKRKGTNKK